MTPKKLPTRASDMTDGRARLHIGKKYLEVADLLAGETGEAINVCVGVAVLAGIAAADAICAVALGERYSGPDHKGAVTLLTRVDHDLGRRLSRLIGLKSESQYGAGLLTAHDRTVSLREATALIEEAERRLIG
ncbi:hypothetical protein WDU99_13075 [Microbacterium sp. Mu-80]|uniref:DNA-binding protein n=1 Tax=Microbacterium bandirmense TaxID=3122050 RepID=A0ABU8LD43_9MICO